VSPVSLVWTEAQLQDLERIARKIYGISFTHLCEGKQTRVLVEYEKEKKQKQS